MSIYSEAIARRAKNRLELSRLGEEYKRRVTEVQAAIDADGELILAAESGFDAAQFVTARDILWVEWGRDRLMTAEVDEVFTAAIEDVRLGAHRLNRGYLGVKSYDGFPSQRADGDYGMGPKHGTIWFRIGLRESHRSQPLTTEESIACAKWLQALRSGALKLNGAR